MTYPDVGTRLTGLSHMMLKCMERTVCPAMSSNVNQHLMGCRYEDVGRDATGTWSRYRCNLVPSWGILDTEVGTSFGPANMRQQSFGSDARFSYPHNAAVDEMTGFLYCITLVVAHRQTIRVFPIEA
jgi:hypothetical protein